MVYIGKTDHSLRARILAHKKEGAFKKYDCFIDFVRLSNSVETDSVEKLLINYYKPAINIKDKTNGFTKELTLPLLNWVPYACYKGSKESSEEAYKRALRSAQLDTELIYMALDCVKDKNMVRYTKFPHISGLLKYKDRQLIVLNPEIIKQDDGFMETFKPKACEFIDQHFNELLFESWKEVVRLSSKNLEEKLIIARTIANLSLTESVTERERLCGEAMTKLKMAGIFKYLEED